MKNSLLFTAILFLTNQSVWAQATEISAVGNDLQNTTSLPATNASTVEPAVEQVGQEQISQLAAATVDVATSLESRLQQRLAAEIGPDTVPHKGFASTY